MRMRDQIICVADVYGRAMGIGRKRISTIVLKRGSKLDQIAKGRDLMTEIFERAMQWFSDNWPDGAEWPRDVPRPSPSNRIPEAAE